MKMTKDKSGKESKNEITKKKIGTRNDQKKDKIKEQERQKRSRNM